MRMDLKLLRVANDLTQEQMADICKVSYPTYRSIENGSSKGKADFWITLQKAFGLSDTKTMELMKSGNNNQEQNCED